MEDARAICILVASIALSLWPALGEAEAYGLLLRPARRATECNGAKRPISVSSPSESSHCIMLFEAL